MNTIDLQNIDIESLKIGSPKLINTDTLRKIYYNSGKFLLKINNCKIYNKELIINIKPQKIMIDKFIKLEDFIFSKTSDTNGISSVKYDSNTGVVISIKHDSSIYNGGIYDVYLRPVSLKHGNNQQSINWKLTEAIKISNPLFVEEVIEDQEDIGKINNTNNDLNIDPEDLHEINMGLYQDDDNHHEEKIKNAVDKKISFLQKQFKTIITKIKKSDRIDALEIMFALEKSFNDL